MKLTNVCVLYIERRFNKVYTRGAWSVVDLILLSLSGWQRCTALRVCWLRLLWHIDRVFSWLLSWEITTGR